MTEKELKKAKRIRNYSLRRNWEGSDEEFEILLDALEVYIEGENIDE